MASEYSSTVTQFTASVSESQITESPGGGISICPNDNLQVCIAVGVIVILIVILLIGFLIMAICLCKMSKKRQSSTTDQDQIITSEEGQGGLANGGFTNATPNVYTTQPPRTALPPSVPNHHPPLADDNQPIYAEDMYDELQAQKLGLGDFAEGPPSATCSCGSSTTRT